jgi:hypothetical protein
MKPDKLLKLQRQSKERHGFTKNQILEQEHRDRQRKLNSGINWHQLSAYIKNKWQ